MPSAKSNHLLNNRSVFFVSSLALIGYKRWGGKTEIKQVQKLITGNKKVMMRQYQEAHKTEADERIQERSPA